MNTQEAKTTIKQFQNWLKVADKMQQVVAEADKFERLAMESEKRWEASEQKLKELEKDRADIALEVEQAREKALAYKQGLEHETKRIKERHRLDREKSEKGLLQVTSESERHVAELLAYTAEVEAECKARAKKAEDAAHKAENNLAALRKRLGAV